MTNEQQTYLINEPEHGYRALFNGCQDAILVAPTGDIIATFTSIEDAMHTADVLNNEHRNADALAVAATAIDAALTSLAWSPTGQLQGQYQEYLTDALVKIDTAPARKVIKPASGVGK